MRLNKLSRFTCLCLCVTLFAIAESARAQTVLQPSDWQVDTVERAGDFRIAEHMGRQSLWLKNSTHVIRAGLEFVDGTIEFDVAPMDRGNFVGILFRREAFPNQENVYLRLHRSGLYNAVQYAPRINGSSTWQLYPEFNAIGNLPRNQWTHVRIEVRGPRLEVFLNNEEKPALVVPRLRGVPKKGSVAFWGRVNDRPELWSAAISNISIKPQVAAVMEPQSAPITIGALDWEVADPVQVDGAVWQIPALTNWRRAEIEEAGLVNLNRAIRAQRGRWTAFARSSVTATEAKNVWLELGYSDDVAVFLNGKLLYQGTNGFESRHPEYMGFVKADYEKVSLDLRPGKNELMLAVTDDQRFGWGFKAILQK